MPSYRIGRLNFSLAGEHPVAAHVRSEFECVRESGEGAAPLHVDFVDTLPPMAGAARVGTVQVADERYQAEHGGLVYQVDGSAGSLAATVAAQRPSWKQELAPSALLRVLDWNYLTPYETTAKNFVYGLFDYLSQVAQLPLGQSYVHASAVERDGEGVALVAWGGIGKTSAMLELVADSGWRYLSDDLVAIDAAGVLFRTPKRLQVYAYNVAGEPVRERALLRGRSPLDRAAWQWRRLTKGPRLVRRRIAAESLFGEACVATRAQLTRALYLQRADTDRFAVRPLRSELLAQRAAVTLLHELQPFFELSTAMHSTDRRPVLPSVTELLEASGAVLRAAFAAVEPQEVTIPLRARPREVAGFVRTLLERRERARL